MKRALSLVALLALSGCYRRAIIETRYVPAPQPPVVYVGGAPAQSAAPTQGSAGGMASGAGYAGGPAGASMCAAPNFAIDDCRMRCSVDLIHGTSDCQGPVAVIAQAGPRARLSVDMSAARALVMEVEICDPAGWVFHMSDSPTGNGWGGDAATTSNDAEFHLNAASPNVGMAVYASDLAQGRYQGAMQSHVFDGTHGCVTRRILVADQQLATDDGLSMCDPALLRINPPSDAEGTPDAMWWVSIGGTFQSSGREGAGMQRMTFCLQ
jgi:hypothetical protein